VRGPLKAKPPTINCRLKSVRQSKGLSQIQLAGLVGVKRQAIYDIESGKYIPNTALALNMAKHLSCRVEDLFSKESEEDEQIATLIEPVDDRNSRVALARVRERLVGYPLSGKSVFDDGFRPSDGLIGKSGNRVRLLNPGDRLDKTILLLGCDPAFSLLNAHVARIAPEVRIHCRFASSLRSLEVLAAGNAHLAGVHLHNSGDEEANVLVTRDRLGGKKALIIGFSHIEEGLMVGPGNPHSIRSVADLAKKTIRLVNREPGAALRVLLDDCLERLNIPASAIDGYQQEVTNHMEGAQMVRYRFADAALGFRAIADACGLDFVPIEAVRCDLVIPLDLKDNPSVRILLDTMQSLRLRRELSALPGYESSHTGVLIAES